jgi:hypothetical protein
MERLLDVITRQRGCFKVRELVELPEGLRLVACHFSLIDEIEFIPDERHDRVRIAQRVDVNEPLVELVEGLALGEVENEDNADGRSKIGFRDRTEPLLTGSVPNLKFHLRSFDIEYRRQKLNTDRRLGIARENIIDKPFENGGLSDTARADDNELEGLAGGGGVGYLT